VGFRFVNHVATGMDAFHNADIASGGLSGIFRGSQL
jgi:hypothetical protein